MPAILPADMMNNMMNGFDFLQIIYRKPNASICNLFIISTVIILFILVLFYFICQCPSTYQKYKCVEVTECKLYMRVDDTKNYKRDNPVSMTRRIQNNIDYSVPGQIAPTLIKIAPTLKKK
jgi:hypothetical protein